MAKYTFFTSRNLYWSRQSQGGGVRIAKRFGWCAAASAIWCANILVKGLKPGDSEPDKTLAGILQVKYRWDPAASGQDALNLLNNVGLKGTVHDDLYQNGALHHMGTYPGVYHFSNDTHAMAADTRAGSYLWYDIESGLHAFGDMEEMKQDIRREYVSQGRVWTVTECRL